MKKRFVVQRKRLVPESGKDWLGNPVEQKEEIDFLCIPGLSEEARNALFESVTVPKLWTTLRKETRFFAKEERAERAAFEIVVSGLGMYMGHVSVERVPGRTDLLKVRRRDPELVNMGRWPNSKRRKREAQEKH